MNFPLSPPQAARRLAVAVVIAASAAAQSAPVVYTSQPAFEAATAAPGHDTFNSLTPNEAIEGPIARTAGAYSYAVAVDPDTSFLNEDSPVPPGYIVAVGSAADIWLSTNSASDTLRFFDLAGAQAIGGLFFGSDVDGLFAGGATLDFLATDTQGTQTYTLASATPGSFVGFVSHAPLLSLAVRALQAGSPVWVTANDLQLAAAVPEPQTLGLVLAGMAFVGLSVRRRRA